MSFEIATTLGASVPVIIAAASAWYSRQRARPETEKRRLCMTMVALRNSLNDIADTGLGIGDVLNTKTFRAANEEQLKELLSLLECQNRHLQEARTHFDVLAEILEIDAPQLKDIKLHLNGKTQRISVIYSVAQNVNLKRRLRRATPSSEVLSEPKDLTPDIRRGKPVLRVEKPGEFDDNYAALVASIPDLTAFIAKSCPMQYRK